MYVISGENAADLDSIIQMSLDLQAAQETRGKFVKIYLLTYIYIPPHLSV